MKPLIVTLFCCFALLSFGQEQEPEKKKKPVTDFLYPQDRIENEQGRGENTPIDLRIEAFRKQRTTAASIEILSYLVAATAIISESNETMIVASGLFLTSRFINMDANRKLR